jgi:predicted Zn-dependent peptidase
MNRKQVAVFVALIVSATAAHAQNAATFDRNVPPALGAATKFTLPAVARGSLANGIAMQVVEHHALPLVHVTLIVDGGSRLEGSQPGLAGFTARMLTEGAGSRDANALQSELAFLGAQLNAGASAESFTIQLSVAKRSLADALDLMADVVLRPTFRSENVKQQRDLRLQSLVQRRDQPTQLAVLAFNQIVFPEGHPYHNSPDGDSASTATLDSARVRAFYQGAFVPERAKFIVAGDVTEPEMRSLLAARFGAWKRAAEPLAIPKITVRPVDNQRTKIYLIDKPGAAQSVIQLGSPGADRLGLDYPAIMVMNTILGASFSSRLNANLRETKGYTYGISSRFAWAPLPGPFTVSAQVRTNVTDSSLVEIFNELRTIRNAAVDPKELARAKAYVALAVPGRFETNASIAAQIADLDEYGLPLSSVNDFVARINAVTTIDVQRVAREYIPLGWPTLVVVGDLAKVRAGIEALKLGTVTVLDVSSIAR